MKQMPWDKRVSALMAAILDQHRGDAVRQVCGLIECATAMGRMMSTDDRQILAHLLTLAAADLERDAGEPLQ